MKKILIVSGLILLLALVVGGPAQAEEINYQGYPAKLEIQLAKIEVSQDGGDNWTTIWEGTSSTLDCATQATSYLVTGIKMDAGDYNGIRLSFHDSVVKGAVTVDPLANFYWTGTAAELRYYYTDPTDDGTNFSLVSLSAAQGLAQDETIDTSGSPMEKISEGTLFTISPGQTTTIELLFTLTNALNYTVDFDIPGPVPLNWQSFTWGLPASFDVTVK